MQETDKFGAFSTIHFLIFPLFCNAVCSVFSLALVVLLPLRSLSSHPTLSASSDALGSPSRLDGHRRLRRERCEAASASEADHDRHFPTFLARRPRRPICPGALSARAHAAGTSTRQPAAPHAESYSHLVRAVRSSAEGSLLALGRSRHAAGHTRATLCVASRRGGRRRPRRDACSKSF